MHSVTFMSLSSIALKFIVVFLLVLQIIKKNVYLCGTQSYFTFSAVSEFYACLESKICLKFPTINNNFALEVAIKILFNDNGATYFI